jgi:DNA (cytosine-5)-methyltransferase 1
MIGNAVPVKLAEYVARCIVQYLTDKASEVLEDLAAKSVQFDNQFAQVCLLD